MRPASNAAFSLLVVLGLTAACGGATTSTGDGSTSGTPDDAGSGNDTGSPDGGAITACSTASDCGVNTGASCARQCEDGSNPCSYACSTTHACVERGCPEDSAPSGCVPNAPTATCA